MKCRSSTIGLTVRRSTSRNTPSNSSVSTCMGRWYLSPSDETNDSSPPWRCAPDSMKAATAATSTVAPTQSTPRRPIALSVVTWCLNIGTETAIATTPRGTSTANTGRQPTKCRNAPNMTSPVRVPTLAPMVGMAKARPRSPGGNVIARIALALPMIMAEPTPAAPLIAIRCQHHQLPGYRQAGKQARAQRGHRNADEEHPDVAVQVAQSRAASSTSDPSTIR